MANDKKFIVKKGLVAPNVEFANGGGTISATYLNSSNTVSFTGNSGQLFSITDSMSGTIFSVNDISGIPSIEVYDTGDIRFAELFGNVAIGSANTSNAKLLVQGKTVLAGNTEVNGILNVTSISANNSLGAAGYALVSNGTSVYWSANPGYTGSAGSAGGTGATGYTGSQGIQGNLGYTGSQGIQGTIGYTGSKGDIGSTGYTGSQGIQGNLGYTGSFGYTGSQGAAGGTGSIGYTGSLGYTGSIGYVGSKGPSTAINATDDTASVSLYPVMVGAAGSDQTPKVTTTKLYFDATDGTMTATNFNSLSDREAKTNINPIENAMPVISNIKPVSFEWKDTGKKGYGVIAQDIEKILPEIVHTNADGKKTVSYDQIIPFLISLIKKHQREIEELKHIVKSKGYYD